MVCLSVCWTHGWPVQKRLNRSRCRLGSRLVWNRILDGTRDSPREGPRVPAEHECVSPATASKCVCPAHVRRLNGWKGGDAASCQITSDILLFKNDNVLLTCHMCLMTHRLWTKFLESIWTLQRFHVLFDS